MAYGTIKVDTITFTDAGVDKSVTISGLVQNPTFSGNITVTGTVSGNTIRGQTVSGATITGGVATITSGVFGLGSASNPSISFTGDANTGFYSPGADQVAVATNGTGRLFINDNGQIGIGTNTSLLYPLNIQSGSGADAIMLRGRLVDDKSTILFVNNGAATNLGWIQVDATGFAIATGSAPTERLRIDATGQIEAASLGTAAAPTFSWTGDPNTGIYSPGADQVAISTGGSGRLFVDASGNVGVGITPANNFHVSGGALTRILVSSTSAGARTDIAFRNSSSTVTTVLGFDGTNSEFDYRSGDLVFKSVGIERLRITSAGLVGIGVTSVTDQLEVASGNFRGATIRCGTTAHRPTLSFFNTADSLAAYIQASGNNLVFGSMATDYGGHSPRMTLTGTGLGIGTTSPANRLHVAGTAQINTGDGADALLLRRQFNNPVDLRLRTYDDSAKDYIFRNDNGSLRFIRNATEVAQLDSSGRLLVGTSTALAAQGVTSSLQLHGATAGQGGGAQSINYWQNNNTSSALLLNKSRSATPGSYTIVQNNDGLGSIAFGGDDGTAIVRAAVIDCQVDGTPGANDMPGRLTFSVTADGASSPTEAMRIKNSRILNFANTPTYADNTAAKAGGLVNGDVYRKSDGTLMIVYT